MSAPFANPSNVTLRRTGSTLDWAHLDFTAIVEAPNGFHVRARVEATLHTDDSRGREDVSPLVRLVRAAESVEQHGETYIAQGQALALDSRQIRELEDAAMRALDEEMEAEIDLTESLHAAIEGWGR